MSAENRINDEMLGGVSGGIWDETRLSSEEHEKYIGIRDKLENMKDTGIGTKEEADRLLKELYDFQQEMSKKYNM